MSLYEHTIVARQDTTEGQLKQLLQNVKLLKKIMVILLKLVGLLNLAYIIKIEKVIIFISKLKVVVI